MLLNEFLPSEEKESFMEKRGNSNLLTKPEEVASAAAWLPLSDESSNVNGVSLPVGPIP